MDLLNNPVGCLLCPAISRLSATNNELYCVRHENTIRYILGGGSLPLAPAPLRVAYATPSAGTPRNAPPEQGSHSYIPLLHPSKKIPNPFKKINPLYHRCKPRLSRFASVRGISARVFAEYYRHIAFGQSHALHCLQRVSFVCVIVCIRHRLPPIECVL
jgi:hypothetical protein